MTLVVVKLNEINCRAVIATNFTHSFCGSALVKSMALNVRDLVNPPAAATSDGTPIEFLGEAQVQLELGPWQSDGLIPLLVAWDCPADLLIGQDLIKEISKHYPVKFEFYKNAVNIGGTRVSMLDPLAAEEKFISVVVMDPHSDKEVGVEMWKKGNKEMCEPGGLVKRRVEVVGRGGKAQEEAEVVKEEAPAGEEGSDQQQQQAKAVDQAKASDQKEEAADVRVEETREQILPVKEQEDFVVMESAAGANEDASPIPMALEDIKIAVGQPEMGDLIIEYEAAELPGSGEGVHKEKEEEQPFDVIAVKKEEEEAAARDGGADSGEELDCELVEK